MVERLITEVYEHVTAARAAVPTPHCIYAHHSVPYGRVYRQWNTRGQLLLWVNRGEIADLPRRPADGPAVGMWGIPVINL